jgi:hypothetical protein
MLEWAPSFGLDELGEEMNVSHINSDCENQNLLNSILCGQAPNLQLVVAAGEKDASAF